MEKHNDLGRFLISSAIIEHRQTANPKLLNACVECVLAYTQAPRSGEIKE